MPRRGLSSLRNGGCSLVLGYVVFISAHAVGLFFDFQDNPGARISFSFDYQATADHGPRCNTFPSCVTFPVEIGESVTHRSSHGTSVGLSAIDSEPASNTQVTIKEFPCRAVLASRHGEPLSG